MSSHTRSLSHVSRRRFHSRGHTFETLEARLALAADLGLTGFVPTLTATAAADTYIAGGCNDSPPLERGATGATCGNPATSRNFGRSPSLIVDGNPNDAALLSWNLSGIPAGSTVRSVSLSVNVTGTSADSYEIYELKRNWSEMQATWNSATSGNDWQSAGAQGALDRGSTVLGTIAASTIGIHNVVLNAAGRSVVQGWIDNPATNFGFILQDYSDTTTDDLVLSSSNVAISAHQPHLKVSYDYNLPNQPRSPFGPEVAAASGAGAGDTFVPTLAASGDLPMSSRVPGSGEHVFAPASLGNHMAGADSPALIFHGGQNVPSRTGNNLPLSSSARTAGNGDSLPGALSSSDSMFASEKERTERLDAIFAAGPEMPWR